MEAVRKAMKNVVRKAIRNVVIVVLGTILEMIVRMRIRRTSIKSSTNLNA